jgi:hypothetical protein
MGTRGITQVIDSTGKTVVAQYGQWDHYPDGQGLNILSFISGYNVVEQLEKALFKCYFATESELEEMYKPYVTPDGMMTMDNSDKFSVMYPSLTRNTGSDILKVVTYSTGRVPLSNQIDFIEDDLMCEGIYTIDFQTRLFVSQYGGRRVVFALDKLPTPELYLNEFSKEEVMA